MDVVTFQRHWQRRDTEANWAAVNPILAAGEFGAVLDGAGLILALKIGDGTTAWLSLPYLTSPMVVLAGGTADALTATFDPVPVLYDGLVVPLRAAAANTAAATLAVNGGTARAITKQGGTALAAGDIAAAGHELLLRYRSSVPRWELLNPAASGGSASVPTGTGFTHITAGAQDAAAVTIDGQSAASGGDVKVIAPGTHAATTKATPVDADELPLVDSAASNVLKKLTWANVKAAMWAAWGALIAAGTGKTTPVNADSFAICDSAASNATKQLTFTNLKAFLKTYFDTIYTGGGSSIGAWADTTTTITGVTSNPTKGTIVRDKIYWRRVGDSMEIRVDYEHSTAGTAGSGNYLILVPDSKTIDTSKIAANTGAKPTPIVGQGVHTDNATFSLAVWITVYDTTHIRIRDNAVGYIGSANRGLNTTGLQMGFVCTVPILEWA